MVKQSFIPTFRAEEDHLVAIFLQDANRVVHSTAASRSCHHGSIKGVPVDVQGTQLIPIGSNS